MKSYQNRVNLSFLLYLLKLSLCSEKGDPNQAPNPPFPFGPACHVLSTTAEKWSQTAREQHKPTLSGNALLLFSRGTRKTAIKGWWIGNKLWKLLDLSKRIWKNTNQHSPLFSSEGIVLQWCWSNLSGLSVCGAVAFCSWTHAVFEVDSKYRLFYFACTTKWRHLGSPFLFIQWKGGIDCYHFCCTAVFKALPTFQRQYRCVDYTHTPCAHTLFFIFYSRLFSLYWI